MFCWYEPMVAALHILRSELISHWYVFWIYFYCWWGYSCAFEYTSSQDYNKCRRWEL